jgi:hypothetical protein
MRKQIERPLCLIVELNTLAGHLCHTALYRALS